jgi:hypothetical protein
MELGIPTLGDLQRDPSTGRILISRGRAEIIAGRSAFAEPFRLFGYDTADYSGLFAESSPFCWTSPRACTPGTSLERP